MDKDRHHFKVQLPTALKTRLAESAREDLRSMHSQLLILLGEALSARDSARDRTR